MGATYHEDPLLLGPWRRKALCLAEKRHLGAGGPHVAAPGYCASLK